MVFAAIVLSQPITSSVLVGGGLVLLWCSRGKWGGGRWGRRMSDHHASLCALITYVFGRDAQYWYRIDNHIGRNSVVGTTVNNPEDLPEDIGSLVS